MRRPSFSYVPLDTQRREIRLFDIQPNSNLCATVFCSVRHVSLLENPRPEYEAISYAWEDVNDRSHIIADGCILDIPASAERSLRRMRLSDRPRTVWIDSGSIHQADIDERSTQVAIMSDIYRHSLQSLVYLGEEDDDTKGWLEEAQQLVSEMYTHPEHEEILQGRGPNRECRIPFRDFPAICALYRRPWFQRLWVIQEVALAPRSVCVCGEQEFAAIELLRIATWIERTMKVDWWHHEGIEAAKGMQSICDKDFGQHRPELTDWDNMAWLIRTAQSSKCTDGRDRVFAVHGLVGSAIRSSIPPLLMPDYKKPVHEVYRDAVRHFHTVQGRDMLLSDVRHQTQADIEGKGSSWVVNWSREFDPYVDPVSLCPFRGVSSTWPEPLINVTEDPNVLSLQGCVIDTVWRCGRTQTPDHWQSKRAAMSLWRSTWRLASGTTQHMYSPSTIWKAVASTLVAESLEIYERATEQDIFLGALHYWQHLHARGECPDLYAQLDPDAEPGLVLASRYKNGLNAAWTHRRFFITHSGRFGMGPRLVKKNDVIAILSGMRTPAVLRPHKGHFKFVGEVYVHGIMDGEATPGLTADDLTALNIR